MLAELLAYCGDQLSYQQDAVATEAYLATARSRISLRRHALLVDYPVHDGCNARTWIRLTVAAPVTLDHTQTQFHTFAPGMPASLAGNETEALAAGVVVFEPMQDADLVPEHNQMQFYTWGEGDCCLAQGATEATLLGSYPKLQIGDVLIFQEVIGPQTGNAADADIRHRWAVRLTRVATENGQGQPLVDPLFEEGTGAPITSAMQQPMPVTQIGWAAADALPFPICLSATYLDSNQNQQTISGVSVAFGNVVLADQGLKMPPSALPVVPEPSLYHPPKPNVDRCTPAAGVAFPVRYRPSLAQGPVTQAVPLPLAGSPVTPNAVALPAIGYAALSDAAGITSLLVAADSPLSWPQYFVVAAAANTANPGNFDLSIIFTPPNGPAGLAAPPVLEQFTNLTLAPGATNYAPTVLNLLSRLVSVPAGYTPPAVNPRFPAAPTPLANTGTVELRDAGATPYLTLQATSPLLWPALFGVLTQGNLQTPAEFNLVVLYQPPSGGVGVPVPVVIEEFDGVSLATVAAAFSAASALISVQSFEDEPNPGLSAYDLVHYDAGQAVPSISLTGSLNGVDSN
jgi:hypothetical protein